jgi:hypothetical protein
MRARLLLSVPLFVIALAAHSQGKHWTETPDETIWRGRYGNCDHGYFVNLPPGVIGHGNHFPSPNHGFLVSAKDPSTTTPVTLEEARLVDVSDSNDTTELGGAQAYVEQYILKSENALGKITILGRRNTNFRGSTAAYVHLQRATEHSRSEVEALVVYRTTIGIGPSFYVIMLRTTPEFYSRDHALYLQIRDGVNFAPVPRGECSND